MKINPTAIFAAASIVAASGQELSAEAEASKDINPDPIPEGNSEDANTSINNFRLKEYPVNVSHRLSTVTVPADPCITHPCLCSCINSYVALWRITETSIPVEVVADLAVVEEVVAVVDLAAVEEEEDTKAISWHLLAVTDVVEEPEAYIHTNKRRLY
ncbi:MAG: hypothetical protein SGARI_006764, partial [Bacillariaceae sp.]